MTYKISLIRCLIHRAFKISSSCIIFHNKLTKIKILLQKNMYLNSVIDNQIKTFLDKQFTVDSVTTSEKRKTLHYILPYIGHFTLDIDIKIAFSPLKLSSFFSCKDTLPKSLQSYVVYQFSCEGCKACYVGETKRHLNTRIKDHLERIKNLIYTYTSKKIHNAKDKLILIVLKL